LHAAATHTTRSPSETSYCLVLCTLYKTLHGCPSSNTERIQNYKKRCVVNPTAKVDFVSVKLIESVSSFLFSGFRIIGRAPELW
jgi:hypothetical protein